MLTLSERDGTFIAYHVELPGEWLHAFLFDWEDGSGEGEQVLSVEAARFGLKITLADLLGLAE